MLDTFEILTTSGVVLWSRSYAPINSSIINNFIADVFIEERAIAAGAKDNQLTSSNPPYKADQHTLKWTFVKELGIIFVVWNTSYKYKCHHVQYSNSNSLLSSIGCLPVPITPLVG